MPRNDSNPPTTLVLLLLPAISNAAAARHQQALSLLEEEEEEEEEDHDAFKAARLRKIEDDDDDDDDEAEIQTRLQIAQLHKRRLQEWRIERYKASLRNQLSRAQVDDAVLRLTDQRLHEPQTCPPSSSSSKPPSSVSSSSSSNDDDDDDDDGDDDLSVLGKKIVSLWNKNQARIRMALPRYVEGYPVRERIQPPRLQARRMQKPSGLGDCLQCLAKGLPCSMSALAKGKGEGLVGRGCRRCVADGERCIVEHEVEDVDDDEKGRAGVEEGVGKESEESGMWDWWDGVPDRDQDVDSAAEAIGMWERRRKGVRLELIGGRMLWVESRGFAPRGMMKAGD